MFSIIFFAFIVIILIAGFLAVTWRKNKKKFRVNEAPMDNTKQRSSSAFNETPTGNIKGGIVPADNKLPSTDFTDENDGHKISTLFYNKSSRCISKKRKIKAGIFILSTSVLAL